MSGISNAEPVGTDAIAVLVEDHRRIRSVFEEFEALPPTAYVHKSKVIARMIDLITVHAYIEDEVLYPKVKALVPELDQEIDSADLSFFTPDTLWPLKTRRRGGRSIPAPPEVPCPFCRTATLV